MMQKYKKRKSKDFWFFDVNTFRFRKVFTNMFWWEYYNPVYAIRRAWLLWKWEANGL